jgi:DNA-binding MarR family transcriptional regulator
MTRRSPTQDAYRNVPLSALLYVTRGTYTAAVRHAQAKVGCGDVPAAGELILNAMEWSGASFESVVRFLGISKQAVSQTVEMLVARGYLDRAQDPVDRRRVKLSLTQRGHTAGRAGRAGIVQVDHELTSRVGAQRVAHARETLVALLEIKRTNERRGRPEGS